MSSAGSKLWSLPVSVAFTAVAMPIVFYLKFGYVDGYAFGVTAFLILLQVAVVVLPRKAEEYREEAARTTPARGPFDFLGVIWLLSIPFAPFFGWLIGNAFDVGESNWRAILGTRAFLCVVVPIVCVLPLVRYVRGRAAGFMSSVLLIGTAFPVLTGAGSAYDVVKGPVWQDVRITELEDIDFRTQAGTRIRTENAFVHLADGRRLTHSASVAVEKGPARLLVLRGVARIIAASRVPP